jgi:hypothetical protein
MEEELRSAEEADRRKKQEEDRIKAQALKPAETPTLPPPEPSKEPASPYSEGAAYTHSEPQQLDLPVMQTESPAESTHPAIHPPSTGEPVPALKPYRSTVDTDSPSIAGSENGQLSLAGSESAATDGAPQAGDIEPVGGQAAHHG